MSASAPSSSLESLIHSTIPQSRSDQVLFNDVLAHCKDVLSRLATPCTWPSFSLTRYLEICSHIGQSHVRDMGHLTEIVKRRRTHWNIPPDYRLIYPVFSVIQSRPDSVTSVQFSNLMSRLMELVTFPQIGVQLAAKHLYSPFCHAITKHSCSCIP